MIWLYCFLLMPVALWLVMEFKGNLQLRLATGIFALFSVGVVAFQTASIKPALHIETQNACLDEMRKIMRNGDIAKIEAAFRVYEEDRSSGRSDYQARREMLAALRLKEQP